MEALNYSLYEDDRELDSRPNVTGSPERRLLLAILERAILDYVGNEKREVEQASTWIFDNSFDNGQDEQEAAPFSFIWICQELDLNPRRIAEVIREMPKRGAARVAPWYLRAREEHKKQTQVVAVNSDLEYSHSRSHPLPGKSKFQLVKGNLAVESRENKQEGKHSFFNPTSERLKIAPKR